MSFTNGSGKFFYRHEQLRIRNIKLEKQFGEELPNILGNAQQLEQVFINILTNARDAMDNQPNAKLTIKSSFLQLSENKGEVTIAFVDNGSGIPELELDKITDRRFWPENGDRTASSI